MTRSISLIQAILLLDGREIHKNSKGYKNHLIGCLELNERNIEAARKLVEQILQKDF